MRKGFCGQLSLGNILPLCPEALLGESEGKWVPEGPTVSHENPSKGIQHLCILFLFCLSPVDIPRNQQLLEH